jgi:NADH-quinone oxidoreductase subunit A
LSYFIIALGLAFLLIFVNENLAPQNSGKEKISPYECGFEPFNDARIRFNIHYFIVALLFIVFDAELVFFFP